MRVDDGNGNDDILKTEIVPEIPHCICYGNWCGLGKHNIRCLLSAQINIGTVGSGGGT